MKTIGLKTAAKVLAISRRLPIAATWPLRMLPWNSTVLGPPKGVTDSSTGEFGEVIRLPGEKIELGDTTKLDDGIAATFRREIPDEMLYPYVTLLRNGRAVEPNAAVITESDHLAGDLCRPIGRLATEHPVFARWKLPRVQSFTGVVGLVHGQRTDSYFHWLFEALGRLSLISAADLRCSRILVEARDELRMQSLKCFGVSQAECVSPSTHPHLAADFFAVPVRLPSGVVLPSVVRALQEKLAPSGSPGGRNLRVYISRQSARRRRLVHGAEIEKVLGEFGFKTVECERLSLSEQINVFQRASIVVAPHGAGLSNIAFCSPGTAVIEMFSADYVNPCYATVAGAAKLRYYAIADGPVDPKRKSVHGRSDIRLRGEVLRDLLRSVIG